jgi:ribonuclease HI
MMEKCYSGFLQVYTDGSRNPESNKTGAGITIPEKNINVNFRLLDSSSIYTAELHAILKALKLLKNLNPQNAVILSDSLASLQAINHPTINTANPKTIWDICTIHQQLLQKGWMIIFQWIPGHAEIAGNEAADKLAKEALHESVNQDSNTVLSPGDISAVIKRESKKMWEEEWKLSNSGETQRFLFQHIAQNLYQSAKWPGLTRKQEVTMRRLRLGAALCGAWSARFFSQSPDCAQCGAQETIQHIIADCPVYAQPRSELKNVTHNNIHLAALLNPSPKEGEFENVFALIKFLTDIGYFERGHQFQSDIAANRERNAPENAHQRETTSISANGPDYTCVTTPEIGHFTPINSAETLTSCHNAPPPAVTYALTQERNSQGGEGNCGNNVSDRRDGGKRGPESDC